MEHFDFLTTNYASELVFNQICCISTCNKIGATRDNACKVHIYIQNVHKRRLLSLQWGYFSAVLLVAKMWSDVVDLKDGMSS